jgi:diacylglycerol kinase (ATP)
MLKQNRGPIRAVMAAKYSWKGLKSAFKYEEAFRQELFLACIAIPVALFVPATINERLALIAASILVLIVELLNSGIEAVVDRVGMEEHELAGRAKDMGSAAVMLTLLLWAMVWAGILIF